MNKKLSYQITHSQNGLTVKAVLLSLGFSRHEISRFKFSNYKLCLNNNFIRVNHVVHTDDVLVIEELENEVFPLGQVTCYPEILYEDEDVVVVNKPSGMPSHPSHLHLQDDMGTALRNYYQDEHFVIRPIGRLDKDVSGIMLYAKNQLAAARLTKMRHTDELKKTYIAIIQGQLPDSGELSFHLSKDNHRRVHTQDGQACKMEYKTLKRSENTTMIEVHLITGRTHQIRAGFAGLGHPLVGDQLYGGSIEHLDRPALHCARVQFKQPFCHQVIDVHVDIPKEMMV